MHWILFRGIEQKGVICHICREKHKNNQNPHIIYLHDYALHLVDLTHKIAQLNYWFVSVARCEKVQELSKL